MYEKIIPSFFFLLQSGAWSYFDQWRKDYGIIGNLYILNHY